MYFQNYGLRNSWVDKCLKSLISEDLSAGNMVNGAIHCFNLNGITFAKFIDECEGNCLAKSLSW